MWDPRNRFVWGNGNLEKKKPASPHPGGFQNRKRKEKEKKKKKKKKKERARIAIQV